MPTDAPALLADPLPPPRALLSHDDVPTALPEDFVGLLIQIRRHIHRNPELGFEEVATSRFIRDTLEAYGLDVIGPLAGTGLYVDIEGARPGGHIGYRADIDALPIQELTEVPFCSNNPGVAHLCGHDAHTTMAIGIALLLHRLRDQLHGTVRVFFQPNEEGMPSGAPRMIHDGVLDGLSAAYAVHVDPSLKVGQFGLRVGAVTAAADRFRVVVRGHSTGHSARPHQAKDTVWLATQVAQAYYPLVGRITDPRLPAILTICRFHGGEGYNVIPSEVEFGGTLRCTNEADREFLLGHMARIAGHYAELYGVDIEVETDHGSPPVINDGRLVRLVERTAHDLYGDGAPFFFDLPSMGAEDFAHYLKHIPGVLVRLGTSSGPSTSYPVHDARFDLDERALGLGVRLMTTVLMRHLADKVLG